MREPIPTWYFALVIVRDGDRFALVQETKHGQRWYLPAGRVEPGVDHRRGSPGDAGRVRAGGGARRHPPRRAHAGGEWHRAVPGLLHRAPGRGRPVEADRRRALLTAAWVTLDELPLYPLRGSEVSDILRHVARGGAVAPLSLLTEEGAPFV